MRVRVCARTEKIFPYFLSLSSSLLYVYRKEISVKCTDGEVEILPSPAEANAGHAACLPEIEARGSVRLQNAFTALPQSSRAKARAACLIQEDEEEEEGHVKEKNMYCFLLRHEVPSHTQNRVILMRPAGHFPSSMNEAKSFNELHDKDAGVQPV